MNLAGAINAIIGSTMPFKYVDGTFNNMNNLPLGVVTVDFANMANVPSGGWGYGVVITTKIADNSNFKTQTAYCTKGSSGGEKNIFMRQQWGGTWWSWERVVREAELNAFIHIEERSLGGRIIGSDGYTDISDYLPTPPTGKSLRFCTVKSFDTTTGGVFVTNDGLRLAGAPNTAITATNITYFYW